MKYKIVVADVDGTLVAPGDEEFKNISQRLISAVEQTKNKGVIFSIATARSLFKLEKLVKMLNLNSPIILANGAQIYDCMVEKYIFNSFIPDQKVSEIINLLQKFQFKIIIDDINQRNYYDPENPRGFKSVIKIVILHITPYEAQEVYEAVSSIKELQVTKSVSGINPIKESIHITSFEAAKEKSLKKVADLMGTNMEQVLTIGDSYNDFSILTASGFKVAMGNSVPEIKAIADYVAPAWQEDGVAHVLEKFIINSNE